MRYLFITVFAWMLAGCAATLPPEELLNARQACAHASATPAIRLVPEDLLIARDALARAEKAFVDEPNSNRTRNLALLAYRLAKQAEALAITATDSMLAAEAERVYGAMQGKLIRSGGEGPTTPERGDSHLTKQPLDTLNGRLLETAEGGPDGETDPAKSAMASEEARGLVITISGGGLTTQDASVLSLAMQDQLKDIVAALMATKMRKLTVEAHTDSRGSPNLNQDLSWLRAEAVRSYIISRGYPGDLIEAQGIGNDRPIADNGSPEGRAKNRRIEIIVDHPAK